MKTRRKKSLAEKYPPSKPCSCKRCLSYCMRPGWWTVEQAASAIEAGCAGRMMLELSPDLSYGVLSPAYRGCEGRYASTLYATQGCTFLQRGSLCELHGTPFKPLECSFCHHERHGQGPRCHADIGRGWDSQAGRDLVVLWSKHTGLWERISATYTVGTFEVIQAGPRPKPPQRGEGPVSG